MSIRNTEGYRLRQREAVQQRLIQTILLRPRHLQLFLFIRSSSGKWSSRNHQQDGPKEFEGEVRKIQKQMGRRPSKCIVGAYYTNSKIPMGEMPYSLVYGSELVILVETGVLSFRTMNFDKEYNEEELRLNVDLLALLRCAKLPTSIKLPSTITIGSSTCHFCLVTWS